jgi:hypothetical protein
VAVAVGVSLGATIVSVAVGGAFVAVGRGVCVGCGVSMGVLVAVGNIRVAVGGREVGVGSRSVGAAIGAAQPASKSTDTPKSPIVSKYLDLGI